MSEPTPIPPAQPNIGPVTARELESQASEGQGPVTEAPVQQEYYMTEVRERWYFPDKITYIEFKKLLEGGKAEFERRTQKDAILERRTQNVRIGMDPAAERHELIRTCVTDWNLIRGGQLVPFNVKNLNDWLRVADPGMVEELAKAIRKLNPWLGGEPTIQEIDDQIAELHELRAQLVEKEQQNLSSDSR
jgi:hypothetical protein